MHICITPYFLLSCQHLNIQQGLNMTTKQAIEHYGGIKQLAAELGIWAHVIYRWGDHPPKARQYELEVKTGGKLKAEKNEN